jgi:hypothetical protein
VVLEIKALIYLNLLKLYSIGFFALASVILKRLNFTLGFLAFSSRDFNNFRDLNDFYWSFNDFNDFNDFGWDFGSLGFSAGL